MKWPFRPRPGVGNDVVYEKKSLLTWLLPHGWSIGFYPFANAASSRNRHAQKLNKICEELVAELHKWAEAGAQVQAERDELDGYKFDHLGVGRVIYMTGKEVSDMIPYVPDVELKFEKFVYKHVIDGIKREYGLKTSDNKKPANKLRPDVMVTTPEGAKGLTTDDAAHVIAWKQEEKKNSSGKRPNKNRMQELREEYPKDPGENKQEWNNRLQEILREERGG